MALPTLRPAGAPRDILGRRLYDQLRAALMLGELRPGDRLTFRDVAARMQTSVTPVREALLQLVAEGVLHAEPGRTITVPRLTRAKFAELRDIRLMLEPEAAERAARRRPPGLVAEMYRLYAELLRNRELGDIPGALRAHRDLHFTLYEAAGMPTLCDLISTVWVGTSPYVVFLYQDPESGMLEPPYIGRGRTVDEHLRMIEALREDDPAGVRAAVVRDIPLGEEIIFKYLLPDAPAGSSTGAPEPAAPPRRVASGVAG